MFLSKKVCDWKDGTDTIRRNLDDILSILNPFSPEVNAKRIGYDHGFLEVDLDVEIGKLNMRFYVDNGYSFVSLPKKVKTGMVDALKEFYK